MYNIAYTTYKQKKMYEKQKETHALISAAQGGDEDALIKLFLHRSGTLSSLAEKYGKDAPSLEVDDLFSAAKEAFFEAVTNYKIGQKSGFSSIYHSRVCKTLEKIVQSANQTLSAEWNYDPQSTQDHTLPSEEEITALEKSFAEALIASESSPRDQEILSRRFGFHGEPAEGYKNIGGNMKLKGAQRGEAPRLLALKALGRLQHSERIENALAITAKQHNIPLEEAREILITQRGGRRVLDTNQMAFLPN